MGGGIRQLILDSHAVSQVFLCILCLVVPFVKDDSREGGVDPLWPQVEALMGCFTVIIHL